MSIAKRTSKPAVSSVKRLSLCVCVLALAVSTWPSAAYAYGKETHTGILDSVISTLRADGRPGHADVLEQYSGWVKSGLSGADEWNYVENLLYRGSLRNHTLRHFQDPWSHQGNAIQAMPSGQLAEQALAMASEEWNVGERSEAMYGLGVALHMLHDATVPHHTDDDGVQYFMGHEYYESFVSRRPLPPGPFTGIYEVSVKGYHPDGVFKTQWHPDGVYADSTPFAFVDYAAHQARVFYEDQYNTWQTFPRNRHRQPYLDELDRLSAAAADELVPLAVQLSAGLASQFLTEQGVSAGSGTVVFDTSKGQNFAGYSQWAADLTDAGYEVRDSGGSLSAMYDADVFVISIHYADFAGIRIPYTTAEALMVSDWVERGGSLILLADHSTTFTSLVQPVAQALGVSLSPVSYGSTVFGPENMDVSSPLVAGVTNVQFFSHSLILQGGSPFIWTNDGGAAACTVEHGRGAAVVFTDCNWPNDPRPGSPYYSAYDNSVLAMNTVDWLMTR